MPRPVIEHGTTTRKAYSEFCLLHPEIKITYQQYKTILFTYNGLVADYILETGDSVKLPHGLGEVTVVKYKRNNTKKVMVGDEEVTIVNKKVDWKKTHEIGKKVYHLNGHTEGYNFFWLWRASTSLIKFKTIWKFKMCREYSRKLGRYLMNEDADYKSIYKIFINRK